MVTDSSEFLKSPVANFNFFSCHIQPVFTFIKFVKVINNAFLVRNQCYGIFKAI